MPPHETPFALTTPHGTHLSGWRFVAHSDLIGVFVHGFRSDCNGTKSVQLANHAANQSRDWLRLDLSGHGKSSGDFRDFRLSVLLKDLEAALASIGKPALLVGSSMGGWLATLAALRRPALIKGLVLIAPAYNFLQLNFGRLPPHDLAAWKESGWRKFLGSDGDSYELNYGVLEDVAAFDLLSRPQTLGCPVTIIHGEHDDAVPLIISERFLAGLTAPAKVFHVVPGGDHRLNGAIPLMQSEIDRLWSIALQQQDG